VQKSNDNKKKRQIKAKVLLKTNELLDKKDSIPQLCQVANNKEQQLHAHDVSPEINFVFDEPTSAFRIAIPSK